MRVPWRVVRREKRRGRRAAGTHACGSLDTRDFAAFYMNGSRIDAAVALNRPRDIRVVTPLIRRRAVVDPDKLYDPHVDLRSLVTA